MCRFRRAELLSNDDVTSLQVNTRGNKMACCQAKRIHSIPNQLSWSSDNGLISATSGIAVLGEQGSAGLDFTILD
jgi:hypothetical protein